MVLCSDIVLRDVRKGLFLKPSWKSSAIKQTQAGKWKTYEAVVRHLGNGISREDRNDLIAFDFMKHYEKESAYILDFT